MVACISILFFAVAVERRSDATLSHRPVVTGGQPWEPRPIFGFSKEVAHMGVEPGISLRMAHVYAPHSHFMPAHPSQYHEVSAEVADVLVDFSSRVEAADLWQPPSRPQPHLPAGGRFLPAQFYLDLDGLPQKEAVPLAQEAGRTVRTQTHLSPAIGPAQHKFTAHVAAALTRPNHLLPAPAEDDSRFLASRSINYLPLDAETHRRLHLLGIHTLGELAALPLPALRVQFGPEIGPCYRMAHGEGDVPVRPQAPEQVEHVSFEFEEPIIDRQTLHRLLDHAAGDLGSRLQEASLAGRKVHWQWETDGGGGGRRRLLCANQRPNRGESRPSCRK